jgi:hypothetical protein
VVYTARSFALEVSALPAVCVMLGDDSIEEQIGRIEHHEQEIIFHFYAVDSADVDKELFDAIASVRESLAIDPSLNGLADDLAWTRLGAPQRQEGNEKFLFSECVAIVHYHGS